MGSLNIELRYRLVEGHILSTTRDFSHSSLSVVLHDKSLVDVGNNTTAGDGGLDQGVKLLISADGELQVTGSHSLHLEVLAGVASELEHLSGEVLKDSCCVDSRRGANAAARVDTTLQESVDAAHRELQSTG